MSARHYSYIKEVVDIIAEYNNRYYAWEIDEADDDYNIALRALWSISCNNLEVLKIATVSDMSIYPVSSCARLILECLTDASYLSEHKEEAREYWRNQDKIKQDLNGRENKWEAFTKGSVNRYGQLSEKRTQVRIEKQLGIEFLGDYNMLCFYTHPNIAALQWINHIGNDELAGSILLSLAHYLNIWFNLLPNPTPTEINMTDVATKLLEAANKHLPGADK